MSGTTTDDYLKKLDEALEKFAIEMATAKPPWSQQYLEVAAVLFPIGITKSHPPISEHLSEPAKDFLDRDFLSVDKRYPKLYVSPEFSKVVVHWPMENLKLPLRTPVRIINSVKNRNVGRVTTYYSMILIRTTNQRSFGIRFKTVIILGNKTFHAMTIESD